MSGIDDGLCFSFGIKCLLNACVFDGFLGGFCIPVYIPYVLTGEWRLGRGLCKLWLVVDYMLCTASVFNIVLISFDRFQSVTKAVSAAKLRKQLDNDIWTHSV